MNFLKRNIPSGWALKKMPDVVKWSSGGTPKATEKSYYEKGTIPWLIIGDLNDGVVTSSASKITELGLQNSSAKMIPVGTLLVAMYGSIGKLGITGIECCTNQAIAYAKELKGVSTKYMYYYMAMMKSELISHGKGGTQKNISQTVLNSLEVLVPPEKEQERIVNKIEELFSELDSAVETLKKTKKQLAVYRQSVLKDAFEDLQQETTLDQCIVEKPRNGYSEKAVEYETKYRNLTLTATTSGFFKEDCFKYIDINIDDDSYLWVKKNDILIQRANTLEYVGTSVVYSGEDNKYVYPDLIMKCRAKPEFLPHFLVYQLQSLNCRKYFREHATGTAGSMPKINQKIVCSAPIKMANKNIQQKIVQNINAQFKACESIEKTVNEALIQADAMRQSILKKAFEGGL